MAKTRERETFGIGNLVRHRRTGELGHVVEDVWGVCLEEEVPVRFQGCEGYEGTDPGLLEQVYVN